MKMSTLFLINAIIAVLFGLGFVLAPATLLAFYAVELPAAGLFIARLLGCAYIGFAIITFLLRNAAGSSTEVRGVLLALWVSELIAFVFALYYQMQGIANAMGWLTVLIFLLLGLGFLYYYVRKPATV